MKAWSMDACMLSGKRNMKVSKIYPVEIYEWNDSWLHDWVHTCNQLVWKERGSGVRNAGPDLHKMPMFDSLTRWFSECLTDLHKQKNYDCGGFKITSMWANHYRPGTQQEAHRHANSYWSAVYYLTGGAPTVFYDPLMQRALGQWDIHTLPIIAPDGAVDDNGPQVYQSDAKKGKLIIFPSWLVHDTRVADIDRYSISFNALPYGKINQGIANIDVL